MKIKIFLLLLVIITLFISCNDENSPINSDKTNKSCKSKRIYDTQSPLVSDSAMNIVRYLFQRNKISLENYQVWQMFSDSSGYMVKCNQFYKHFQIYYYEVYFHFNHDVLFDMTGELINYIPFDTIPGVGINEASREFHSQISNDWFYADSASKFCNYGFNAELGFYDLNQFKKLSKTKRFVLAWKFTVVRPVKYPVAYIRADSLSTIYYTNGFIVN